jgi:Zn-finger nucleic acid-binding protein
MPIKPTDAEEEYFKREDLRKIKKLREQYAREVREAKKEDLEKLKELHWMRCPKCGMELTELDFRGMKVDSCLTCGGMFLDKGEIEKAMAYKEPGWLGRSVMAFFGAEDELDSTQD